MSTRVVLYNPNTREASEATIKSYTNYYELLKCTTFDIVMMEKFNVYVDDEGLMKKNILTQIDGSQSPYAGNLVFTGEVDDEGETLALPEEFTLEDIEAICRYAGNIR